MNRLTFLSRIICFFKGHNFKSLGSHCWRCGVKFKPNIKKLKKLWNRL